MVKRRIAVCVLVALMLAAPAKAQDFIDWQQITSRAAGTVIPVYDPVADDYRWITFEDLLGGVVVFDDELTRYVAVKARDPNNPTAPDFAASDFTGTNGTSVTGFLTSVAFPTMPSGATGVWVAIAVPVSTPLTYMDWAFQAGGFNTINIMEELTTPITIGTGQYTVWRSYTAHTVAFLAVSNVYFHQQAVDP